MGMVTRAKKRRLEEEEEQERLEDRISLLPDGVLGDIVSLLPTKDGARTQILSSRWRHIWRAAPLNFDLLGHPVSVADVSRVLAAHPGPCRRFCTPLRYAEPGERSAATLDGWLRCPALGNLEELRCHYGFPRLGLLSSDHLPPPLPAAAQRVWSTLRVAAFDGFRFPDRDDAAAGALQLPVLEQLSLSFVIISEGSLHALLAGCPVLQSLLLAGNNGLSRLRLVSPCLRSIGVRVHCGYTKFQQLIIEDAPCLERLLLFGIYFEKVLDISVISAPKLATLGQISDRFPKLKFDTTIFQGSNLVSMAAVVHSVKILALTNNHLSLDVAINFIKCFPCLEKLYIRVTTAAGKNLGCQKYRDLIDTLDIHLKKIVLTNYRGNKSHVNFAKFFVLNARLLESMVFELTKDGIPNHAWIETQHSLLQIKNKASSGARFDFVHRDRWLEPLGYFSDEQTHELSTADPFVRFWEWV
ncbi:unnamed protein product [Urochloa decumbens]|uniref:FBD domain-containing protein n=1 Tax=Urochloa decumbens TaxID=240449 RepID=A0ABC9GQU2_9POAL